jgi:hypothetical protein
LTTSRTNVDCIFELECHNVRLLKNRTKQKNKYFTNRNMTRT